MTTANTDPNHYLRSPNGVLHLRAYSRRRASPAPGPSQGAPMSAATALSETERLLMPL